MAHLQTVIYNQCTLPKIKEPFLKKEAYLVLQSDKNRRSVKKDALENRMNLSNHRGTIPHAKLLTGSIAGKFPVVLDGGRTIIFISDKSKEAETRYKYGLRKK